MINLLKKDNTNRILKQKIETMTHIQLLIMETVNQENQQTQSNSFFF